MPDQNAWRMPDDKPMRACALRCTTRKVRSENACSKDDVSDIRIQIVRARKLVLDDLVPISVRSAPVGRARFMVMDVPL